MKNIIRAAAFMAAFVGIMGCQQAPTTEFEAARAAIQQADSVEADIYVADLYAAALDSFTAAQAEIDAQNAASSFSRDYSRAGKLIAFSIQAAEEAQTEVEGAKELVRAQADSLIAIVQQTVATAPQNAVMEAEQVGTPSAATLVQEAIQARDAGDYKTARDQAQAAIDRLNAAPAEADAATAPRS